MFQELLEDGKKKVKMRGGKKRKKQQKVPLGRNTLASLHSPLAVRMSDSNQCQGHNGQP